MSASASPAARRCILCGSGEAEPYCAGIVRCRGCGLIYADTRLTDEELASLYGTGYFFGEEYVDYLADKETIQRNFERRLRVLERFLPSKGPLSLWEIGCAYGFFLDLARKHFASVKGNDVHPEGVRHAREALGLDALQGDFLDIDLGGRRFDVFCLWDVVEHLRDPDATLAKASAHAGPGSLVALTTGDVGSLVARLRGGKWRLIHPPTHLFYFSRTTLGRMLDKHGFDVVYARPCGFTRSLNTVAGTLLESTGRAPGLVRLLRKTGVLDVGFYVNLYDILYVIAKKR